MHEDNSNCCIKRKLCVVFESVLEFPWPQVWDQQKRSLSSGRLNDFINDCLHDLCSLVRSELGSGGLDSLLFFGCDTGSNKLEHFLLKVGESSDFSDDLSNVDASLGDLTFSSNWSLFPVFRGHGSLLTFLKADEESCSAVVSHVFYNPTSK